VRPYIFISLTVSLVVANAVWAADRQWENPVFDTAEQAVATAKQQVDRVDATDQAALRLFVDLALGEGDQPSLTTTRRVVEDFLVTHSAAFDRDDVQRRTVDRFLAEMPRQTKVIDRRLARFGYPELPGMVYLRLVESVDAFANLNRSSSDRMSRVGGVTYYCRYIVLPLSYVSREGLDELRRSGALSPSADIEATIRQWQNESFASLVNTFRHELVHVHTNTALGLPRYSNRSAYPTWFHEGTATYLANDPHAGLSQGYQEFQELFFYLVQRYGVRNLQDFYTDVLGGNDVGTALTAVYALGDSEQLFQRSRRWHRTKELIKTGLWIVGLVIVVSVFRGADGPYIGVLQLLGAAALGLAVATGVAEHLYGLRGPAVVLVAKAGIALLAIGLGAMGIRRIRRYRDHSIASGRA